MSTQTNPAGPAAGTWPYRLAPALFPANRLIPASRQILVLTSYPILNPALRTR